MQGAIKFQAFENRTAASAAAAGLLERLVGDVLAAAPTAEASMVVSGGSTPGPCFDMLSQAPLDWSRVTVIPSDERWVPCDDPNSNERLIKERLLHGRAGNGKMLSFYRAGLDPSQAPSVIGKELAGLAQPFTATLLGMGEDGHFASLFPDFDGLQEALDPHGSVKCFKVQTKSSPHLRISLSLSALLGSAHIVLLIFGEAKRRIYDAALAGGSGYPVEALLNHVRKTLTVVWAP